MVLFVNRDDEIWRHLYTNTRVTRLRAIRWPFEIKFLWLKVVPNATFSRLLTDSMRGLIRRWVGKLGGFLVSRNRLK